MWSEEGGRWPRVWRKNGCGFLFGVVGGEQWDARSRVWALGWRRQEGRVMQPGRRGRVAPSIWMGGRRCVRWRWRGEVLPSGQRAAGGGVPRARVDNCLATSQEARRQDGGR